MLGTLDNCPGFFFFRCLQDKLEVVSFYLKIIL